VLCSSGLRIVQSANTTQYSSSLRNSGPLNLAPGMLPPSSLTMHDGVIFIFIIGVANLRTPRSLSPNELPEFQSEQGFQG
jgi:hypothetical protein